ncbi:MAG: hypothetical protein RLZZ241_2434 [Bacteroidota bacterium]|jgi:hypothetical protein
MIFNGLKEKFKRISAGKFIKQESAKSFNPNKLNKELKQVGVLVDLDRFSNLDQFNGLSSLLNLSPVAIRIVGYSKSAVKDKVFSVPVLTDRNLGWNGMIEFQPMNDFIGQEYDLLINYFNEDNLMLKLANVHITAGLRVGFLSAPAYLNDLIINVNPLEYMAFEAELQRYLKVLTKWL